MRTETAVADGDGFAVRRVEIRSDTDRWWPPEVPPAYRVTLVRAGVFRARVPGRTLLADPATAYVAWSETAIAHRPGSVDVCTAVDVSEPYLADLTGGAEPPAQIPISGELAVEHRLLALRAAAGADAFELAERLALLLGALLTDQSPERTSREQISRAQTGPKRTNPARTSREGAGLDRTGLECASKERAGLGRTGRSARSPSGASSARTIVEAARELVNADPAGLGLRDLAARAGCSPYHLSRVFHAETGLTLTAYRNRIRVLHAVEALEAGHPDLAALAAGLGFADHAHLTRTVRQECGRTPSALRRILRNDVQAPRRRRDADSSS